MNRPDWSMTLRCPPLRCVGLTWMLLLGSLAGTALHAQDRGAPRFGPSASDTSDAAVAGDGRLWSVAAPPFDRFEQRYGVEADSAWATHLRRGVLRLPGCTAALVSPQGLALTAAECIRPHLRDGRDDAAVVSAQRADEQAVPGLYAERLVKTADVTAQVKAAQQDTSAQEARAAVERQLQSEVGANRRVQVAPVSGGASYTAHTYRRYDDVRLAFLPESGVSDFGGADAAMTYPRSSLDAALIRVYTGKDTPLRSEHFFESPAQDLRPGDAVFAVGHPPRTRRGESADQLAVRRDLGLQNRAALFETWTAAVRAYLDTTAGEAPQWTRALRTGAGHQKQAEARLEALQTESIMARLRRRDDALRQGLRQADPLQRRYGGLLDSLLAIQADKRSLIPAYRAFDTFGAERYTSTTFRRLMQGLRMTDGGDEAAARKTVPIALADSSRPSSVETALLAERLNRVVTFLRPDTAAVERLLAGRTTTQLAARIVQGSVLASPTYHPGGRLVVPPDDPAATLVDVLTPHVRSFFEDWGPLVRAERSLTRRLARARHAVGTTPLLPSSQRSPRLTDGRVRGYPYNGTLAPPLTTFYGLYGQSAAFGAAPWALPERWRQASSALDRSVPLTFAASTDPVAARPGAPLLNKYLQLVGVATGPNIQGVASEYLFLPERMRTVAVDLRGLRQSLRVVYEADRLAEELFGEPTATPSPQR